MFPIFRKYGTNEKVSAIDSSHRTRPERTEEVDARRRAYKSGIFLNRQIAYFGILHHQMRIGKLHTYMLVAYVTRSVDSGRTKNLASFNRAIQIFQAQATYGCLLDRAGCRQSDQFSNSGREKGSVSSSYSSAVEFPTAITDRLCEQQGATQIPGSSRATYGYRANNGTVLQY